MKKKIKIIIIIIAILATMLILGTMYLIDKNRMENNKPVVFSTWGYDYAPPEANNSVQDDSGKPTNENQDTANQKEYNSFVGTILEETTTYMIVEPNEDEPERKSSDKIVINYGTDHIDYLYGVGRKVVISYTGYIMETYPAQINTDKISVDGYSEFELTAKKAEEVKTKKILNNKDLNKYNSDYNLYYYGLEEVKVKVNNEEISLEEALNKGKVTLEGIIKKANKDYPDSISYEDGGSMEYHYDTYTIIKCHTLDGNRDVWIGIPEMTLNHINK